MSKFISRINRNTETFCITLHNFELFAPGTDKEYEHLCIELQRGRARKVIQASCAPHEDQTQDQDGLKQMHTISINNKRIYFNQPFLQTSKFYMNKKLEA